ncbi:hypothetical protein, partial [Actinoplanes sp. NPDC026619]|uniref:hypothetical protein n=1 Tax=Actinoplanes sp. NPDC026619 TaxID=3155798 RepID=UPI0033D91782
MAALSVTPPQDPRPQPPSGLLAAALRYAAAGIPVMPLHTPARGRGGGGPPRGAGV